jgi:hypothetical protein
MKKIENTSTTGEESFTERKRKYKNSMGNSSKMSEEKLLALLKLVHHERKSIKQCSKYLSINYNSAKRIVKNYRKNKLCFNKKKLDSEKIETKIKEYAIANPKDKNFASLSEKSSIDNEKLIFEYLSTQINFFGCQLIMINKEIKQNQNILEYLFFQTLQEKQSKINQI